MASFGAPIAGMVVARMSSCDGGTMIGVAGTPVLADSVSIICVGERDVWSVLGLIT